MIRYFLIIIWLGWLSSSSAQDFPIIAPGTTIQPLGPVKPTSIEPLTPEVDLLAPFQILDRFVVPGTRVQLEWRAPDDIGRGELPSPIIVVHGAKPGLVLCLIAGVHGDEINGIEIVRQIAHDIDPTRLSGTIVAAPIVNVFGYSRGSRYLPDRRDLNRHFPGSRFGSIASRMAHGFFDQIVRRCDSLIDFHTGSFQRSNLPQVRADLTTPEALEFTRGFGETLVLHSPGRRGMLRNSAMAEGIPAVTFEVGSPQRLELEHIEPAVVSMQRLMQHLEMIERDDKKNAEPQPTFFESRWVRTNAGGLLISEVKLGDRVSEGKRLGRVIDPVSNLERDVLAPFPGRVLGMALNQQVLPGYAAFHLGKETSEQQAVIDATTAPQTDTVVEDDAEVDANAERSGVVDEEVE